MALVKWSVLSNDRLIVRLNEGRLIALAQLVKASVGQADVQRFEPHFGNNWLSCSVFLVKSRHFGLCQIGNLS